MISTAVICANLLVTLAILYVIPIRRTAAQAGFSAQYRDDKIPADAGMTV